MDKERLFRISDSHSETRQDLAVDKTANDNNAQSGIVIDPQKKKKKDQK